MPNCDFEAPAGADHGGAVLIALFLIPTAILACLAVRAQYRRWRPSRALRLRPLPRRLSPAQLAFGGAIRILFATTLCVSWRAGAWNAAAVGLHHSSILVAILVGELGYLALVLLYGGVVVAIGNKLRMRVAAVRGNLRIWPRGRTAKAFAILFIMVMNPFVEELVMRGILIHQWGIVLGSAAVPIAVGFVLNASLHAYQGWRMQLFHALFFAFVVILLYSSFGLASAITAHVFGDVLPILHLRRNQLRARADRHAARMAHVRCAPRQTGGG